MKSGKGGLSVSPRSSQAERSFLIKLGRNSTVSGKRVDGHGREAVLTNQAANRVVSRSIAVKDAAFVSDLETKAVFIFSERNISLWRAGVS